MGTHRACRCAIAGSRSRRRRITRGGEPERCGGGGRFKSCHCDSIWRLIGSGLKWHRPVEQYASITLVRVPRNCTIELRRWQTVHERHGLAPGNGSNRSQEADFGARIAHGLGCCVYLCGNFACGYRSCCVARLEQLRAVARPATRSPAPGGASVPNAAAPTVSGYDKLGSNRRLDYGHLCRVAFREHGQRRRVNLQNPA